MSEAPATGRPGRYQRSVGGLVGALVILLGVVGAFVAVRALARGEIEVRPEPVDYLATVRNVQAAGLEVVYPASLPADWLATTVSLRPAVEESWGISMLADDGTYVGLRQDDKELDDLLTTYVDENVTEVEAVAIESRLAGRWRVFTDEGGDTAYAARAGPGRAWVVVYGSADRGRLERIVVALTRDPA